MAEITKGRQPFVNLKGSQTEDEPLQNIPVEHLEDLLNILRQDIPRNLSAVGAVENVIRWRKNERIFHYHQIYAPFGNFKAGTCVSIFRTPGVSYEAVTFYSQNLHDSEIADALVKTKLINWNENERLTVFYAVPEKMTPLIDKLAFEKNLEKVFSARTEWFWMDKEEARNIKLNCPPDVILKELTIEHIEYLDEQWPHRFKGSKVYLRTLLEQNFGLGVFLPPAEDPVSWAVLSESSSITMLFTIPTYRRRGYARLICAAMAQKLGEMGVNPHGTVVGDNHSSKMMFKSLGFKTGSIRHLIRLKPKPVLR